MVFFAPVIVKYMKKNLDTMTLELTNEFGRSPATSLNWGSTVLGVFQLQIEVVFRKVLTKTKMTCKMTEKQHTGTDTSSLSYKGVSLTALLVKRELTVL